MIMEGEGERPGMTFRLFLLFMILATGPLSAQDAAAPGIGMVARLISGAEPGVHDATGWAVDLIDVLNQHSLPPSRENVCAAIAVIDQESGFVADPAVPNLGALSEKAMRTKFLKVPILGRMALNFLDRTPSPEASYMARIRAARTERDLDMTWRAMVADASKRSSMSFVVNAGLFNTLIEEHNEISTVGSMQVSVRFALDEARKRRWLPMTLEDTYAVRDDLYTRHGGMYYGVLQLLGYDTGYAQKLYRFADYNAGRYASRNAALQQLVATLSGDRLTLDGDLLLYDSTGKPLPRVSSSEAAIRRLVTRLNLGLTNQQIRDDLLRAKDQSFAASRLFLALREAYRQKTGKAAPFAMVPDIALASPKIKRRMTTRIFADTVNQRYQRCMAAQQ